MKFLQRSDSACHRWPAKDSHGEQWSMTNSVHCELSFVDNWFEIYQLRSGG
jgi:hypothetical protein